MLAFSNEIALGLVHGEQLLIGLAVQFAWVAALWGLVLLLWRLGVRSYGAVGA